VESIESGELDKISLCIAKDILRNIEKFYQEYSEATTESEVQRAFCRILQYGPLKIEAGEGSKVKGFVCHITAIGLKDYGLLSFSYKEGESIHRICQRFCDLNPALSELVVNEDINRRPFLVPRGSRLFVCLPYNKVPFVTAFPLRMRNLAARERYERLYRSVDEN
jgi:hypothetical protein